MVAAGELFVAKSPFSVKQTINILFLVSVHQKKSDIYAHIVSVARKSRFHYDLILPGNISQQFTRRWRIVGEKS